MFSVLTASKRVQYHLYTQSALRYFFILNSALDMYESEYFPLVKMLRPRFLKNWARRWREVLLYGTLLGPALLGRVRIKPVDYLR